MTDILSELEKLNKKNIVPLHMPGAKRNGKLFHMGNPYELDITEINEFDNLHNASGIIKKAFERAADLFGADETLFLVNGSSAGIMAALCGATKKNDKVLVARNVHRSVINAIYLNELNPIYMYPNNVMYENIKTDIYGKIDPIEIEKQLHENADIKAVIITSPTYEGIVSDVKRIVDIVHSYNCILIVDEAHGAHFNFSDKFPQSAVLCGADLVIQSLHKTLPSFTQTALLHINGKYVNRDRVKMYWNMYQSTSPSYLLMGSIDRCLSIISQNGEELFSIYLKNLLVLRENINKLKYIKILPTDDVSKIVLLVKNGKKFADKLYEDYKIQLEMASCNYVIAMTSVGDDISYYNRFYEALTKMDKIEYLYDNLKKNRYDIDINVVSNKITEHVSLMEKNRPIVIMNIFDAVNMDSELIKIENAKGRISGEQICFYPPGINIVNPGELITKNIVDILKDGIDMGLEVIGIDENKNIKCVKSDCE